MQAETHYHLTLLVVVNLYYDMPKSTKEQICALLATSQPVIGLDFVNVQHQTNRSLCTCILHFSLCRLDSVQARNVCLVYACR